MDLQLETICVAMDIETRCNQPGCPGQKEMTACKHGLDPFKSDFVCCGFYWEEEGVPKKFVVHSIPALQSVLSLHPEWVFTGCNFKFDLNYLYHKYVHILDSQWLHDVQLMANSFTHKVSKAYSEYYEAQRNIKQKERGIKLREVGQYSLKILAPYFLHVEPFWETGGTDDEYCLKDCEYTYKLTKFFIDELVNEKTYDFYSKKLIPWTKTLMHMERSGIRIDLDLLEKKVEEANIEKDILINKLDDMWEGVHNTFKSIQKGLVEIKYAELLDKAIKKLKDPKEAKIEAVKTRYDKLKTEAISKVKTKVDINSNKDMLWVLRDYFKYPVKNVKGKETTGKAILNNIIETKNPELQVYLDYRKAEKLATAFYPSYRDIQNNGIIRCSFNPSGTRTGRLSSSNPNLQQVPGKIKELFVAEPGNLLATYDQSAIETILIAYYTEDPILLDIIFSGLDFHGVNAKLYFPEITCKPNEVKEKHKPERDFAKRLGYALFYGAGSNRIYETAIEMGYNWPKARCKEIYDNVKERYRQVFEFKYEIDYRVKTEPLMNMFGRYQYFEDFSDIHMKNFNRLIQSSASDLVWDSAYKISQLHGYKVKLLVHDEIVTEISESKRDEAAEVIPYIMTDYKLPTSRGNIPLKVEGSIDKYWKK